MLDLNKLLQSVDAKVVAQAHQNAQAVNQAAVSMNYINMPPIC